MTEKVEEICIRDQQTIADIKQIQSYIKAKGEIVTESEVVQACINVARRMSAGNWGVYLEIRHSRNKYFFEEVRRE